MSDERFEDGVVHRCFECAATADARLSFVEDLRELFAGILEDSMSDAKVVASLFVWDVMVRHHHHAFPPMVDLERFITPPKLLCDGLADIFHRYLAASGLKRLFTRSLRPFVQEALADDWSV